MDKVGDIMKNFRFTFGPTNKLDEINENLYKDNLK